ncbi:hypothetical protein FQN51_009357 [Onygenales sp. PD_10]|nr:hypothetical protein FQN51_009357 [Onygenales sp. PD_10]
MSKMDLTTSFIDSLRDSSSSLQYMATSQNTAVLRKQIDFIKSELVSPERPAEEE